MARAMDTAPLAIIPGKVAGAPGAVVDRTSGIDRASEQPCGSDRGKVPGIRGEVTGEPRESASLRQLGDEEPIRRVVRRIIGDERGAVPDVLYAASPVTRSEWKDRRAMPSFLGCAAADPQLVVLEWTLRFEQQ